jgi:hypothetical protein
MIHTLHVDLHGYLDVGFDVLTAVAMRSSVFSEITKCSPVKAKRHFGGNISPPL